MKLVRPLLLATVLQLALLAPARADLVEQLRSLAKGTNQSVLATAALSQGEVAAGLKEALAKGVERAVSSLGRTGGYLTNLAARRT